MRVEVVVSRRCDAWEMGIGDGEEEIGMTVDAKVGAASTSGAHELAYVIEGTAGGDCSCSGVGGFRESEVDILEVCGSVCPSCEEGDFVSYGLVGYEYDEDFVSYGVEGCASYVMEDCVSYVREDFVTYVAGGCASYVVVIYLHDVDWDLFSSDQ